MVEHLVANENVARSNRVTRLFFLLLTIYRTGLRMLVLLASLGCIATQEQGPYLGFSPYWLLAPTGLPTSGRRYAKVWQLCLLAFLGCIATQEQQRLLAFGEQVLALLAVGEQGQQEFRSAVGCSPSCSAKLSMSSRRAQRS